MTAWATADGTRWRASRGDFAPAFIGAARLAPSPPSGDSGRHREPLGRPLDGLARRPYTAPSERRRHHLIDQEDRHERHPDPLPSQPDRTQGASSGPDDGRAAELGGYRDDAGRERALITRPGAGGSALVIDQDAGTLADRRLVAHLAADEPAANARIAADLYLGEPDGRFARPLEDRDWLSLPDSRVRPRSPSRPRPASCATGAGAATTWAPSTTTAMAARRARCAAAREGAPRR